MFKKIVVVVFLCINSVLPASGLIDLLKKENLYAGFQSSGYTYGLSAKIDLNEKVALQGIIGFIGTVNHYTVRGLYKFKQDQLYNLYGFGSVGLWTWDGIGTHGSESVFGVGGGAGLEYDLRGFDSTFAPLFANVEIQATIVSFDHYSYGATRLGIGLHYKF